MGTQKHPSLIKTLRFGPSRKKHTPNRNNPIDTTTLVRVGIPPLEMPDRWTWCSWFIQDFQHREWVFFYMAGTVSGRSILSHDDPETEGSFYNQTKLQKSFFLMTFWWEQFLTQWGEKWDNMKKLPPVFNQWRFFCVAVETKKGTIIIYVDGEVIDQKVMPQGEGEGAWSLEKNMNASSGEITDIWLGGIPKYSGGYFWNSFGRMSQIHWFDRILTHDEMVGMTTCNGKKLKGNLINWETTKFEFTWDYLGGWHIFEIWASLETVCPKKEYGGIFVPSSVEFEDAVELCSVLKREVIAIDSENEEDAFELMRDINENMLYYNYYYYYHWNGIYNTGITVLSAFTDEDLDLKFENHYTGAPCNHNVTGWNVDQPYYIPIDPNFKPMNSVYKLFKGSDKDNIGNDWPIDLYRNETILMERGTRAGQAFTICTGNFQGASSLNVKIKGLCEETEYDVEYTWYWYGSWGKGNQHRYIGPENGSIYYVHDGLWRIEKVRQNL